jgi:hypothetical protein
MDARQIGVLKDRMRATAELSITGFTRAIEDLVDEPTLIAQRQFGTTPTKSGRLPNAGELAAKVREVADGYTPRSRARVDEFYAALASWAELTAQHQVADVVVQVANALKAEAVRALYECGQCKDHVVSRVLAEAARFLDRKPAIEISQPGPGSTSDIRSARMASAGPSVMLAALRPCSTDRMRVYRVGSRVGNVQNNDASLLDPTVQI